MEIKFEPFKTRQQIADELHMSARFLSHQLKNNNLDIPARKRLDIEGQISIYTKILGKQSLANTEYEKYLNENLS